MTWLTAKHILKKIWIWTKSHWWAGVILVVGFVITRFAKKRAKYFYQEMYHDKIKQGKEELEVVNNAHKEEIKKVKKAQEDFNIVVAAVEEERKAQGEQIKRQEKKRIKQIIEMPDDLRLHVLADEFGLEIVEVVDE